MASVIDVFNADGTKQSVSLHSQVKAHEVVQAIARRRGTPREAVDSFALYRVIVWREAEGDGLSGPDLTKIQVRVQLQRLGPDDRPLAVRADCETAVEVATKAQLRGGLGEQGGAYPGRFVVNASIAFAFLDAEGERHFQRHGDEILSGGGRAAPNAYSTRRPAGAGRDAASAAASNLQRRGGRSSRSPGASERALAKRLEFQPINALGRGDKSGFLFQRSAANPREWQRRWCILERDELVHCLSNVDQTDARSVRLTQNHVRAIPPHELGGLKHCFEIDTAHDVLQFRAKTDEEAAQWIAAIRRNIDLASENENFHLAERMIEDGQRSLCTRDEAVLETALGSLEGLLSTHAGADRLFRFAKRSFLGEQRDRNAELVAFYLDLERAHHAFSSIPSDGADPGLLGHRGGAGAAQRSSLRYLQVGPGSVTSSSGSSLTGQTLRGTAAALSRKEWMLQICERFASLYEPVGNLGAAPTGAGLAGLQEAAVPTSPLSEGAGEGEAVESILRAMDKLRRELADESLRFIPRESCLVVIEEARKTVLDGLAGGLYKSFRSSSEYERVLATIPSRIRRHQS